MLRFSRFLMIVSACFVRAVDLCDIVSLPFCAANAVKFIVRAAVRCGSGAWQQPVNDSDGFSIAFRSGKAQVCQEVMN